MGVKQFVKNLSTLGNVNVPELQTRLQEQSEKLVEYAARTTEAEERAAHFYQIHLTDHSVPDEVKGLNNQAMRVSTLFACVLVRAEAGSTIPFSVLQDTETGSVVARKQPLHKLIHSKPNPHQTAAQFWKTVIAKIDLDGEVFVKVKYSGRMQPTRMDIIQCSPSEVQILETDGGEVYYKYKDKTYQYWEMFHFMDLSIDGIRGCSKIRYNAETIGYSKQLRTYGSNAVATKPPGYFSTEAPYAAIKSQEKDMQEGWKTNIGEGNTPFLPFGMKYHNLMISPGDAQYLEAIGATKEEITAIMRVPPTLIQDYGRATFANAEQQDLVFVKYTMLPIITNIEQELNSKGFPESNENSETPFYVKGNVNAFMRGDFKTRTEGYKTLVQNGLMSINQVAELEDWAKVEGGDERYLPMNVIPLSMQKQFIEKLTAPVSTNAGDDGGADNSARSHS